MTSKYAKTKVFLRQTRLIRIGAIVYTVAFFLYVAARAAVCKNPGCNRLSSYVYASV